MKVIRYLEPGVVLSPCQYAFRWLLVLAADRHGRVRQLPMVGDGSVQGSGRGAEENQPDRGDHSDFSLARIVLQRVRQGDIAVQAKGRLILPESIFCNACCN